MLATGEITEEEAEQYRAALEEAFRVPHHRGRRGGDPPPPA
ncbi:hypothetical protein [Geodermatophilus sp. DSM 45219]|nr:hypothetical protein [Geodermatophilus sp. DSM 45219]